MKNEILGIHHITAIAGNAKKNYDFYTRILGLRLVKKRLISMILILTISIMEMNTEPREAF
jgi:catechol 2,3-dioxygenase-like lactoylglutathione lyase family enzyme